MHQTLLEVESTWGHRAREKRIKGKELFGDLDRLLNSLTTTNRQASSNNCILRGGNGEGLRRQGVTGSKSRLGIGNCALLHPLSMQNMDKPTYLKQSVTVFLFPQNLTSP